MIWFVKDKEEDAFFDAMGDLLEKIAERIRGLEEKKKRDIDEALTGCAHSRSKRMSGSRGPPWNHLRGARATRGARAIADHQALGHSDKQPALKRCWCLTIRWVIGRGQRAAEAPSLARCAMSCLSFA